MKNKKIWLVLSWWWVNWFIYIGAMKFLQENWISPVLVWWTSVWSIFSAMISAGYSWQEMRDYTLDLEKRMKNIKDINWKEISKSVLLMNIDNVRWILKWNKTKEEIWTLLKRKNILKFKDLNIPYFLHMVNLNTAEDVLIHSLDKNILNKEVLNYIRASISLPWVFTPVEIDNKFFIDWWIRSNYPILSSVKIAKENNIKLDSVLSINIFNDYCEEDNFQNESFLEIMVRGMSISVSDQHEADNEIFIKKYPEIELINVNIKKIFKNSILTAKISDAIDYWYSQMESQLINKL